MKKVITSLFQERNEHPLFYIESGSRLWGIASPDSDYDVRGFHLQSKEKYYDFQKHRDIIEIMDGDFDFVSYDIDKMFGLLAKSNPTVLEWIRAHIVYFNQLPDWEEVRKRILAHIDYRALYHHYLSLAKSQIHLMESDRKFTYKKTFYAIRGLLSAELASQQILPQLRIEQLFDQFDKEQDVIRIAKDSLEKKKSSTEKEEVEGGQKAVILSRIKRYAQQLEGMVPEKANNSDVLKAILKDYSFTLKSKCYG